MLSKSLGQNRKTSNMAKVVVVFVVLLVGYFGAYYANIEHRVPPVPGFGSSDEKIVYYRFCQQWSEFVFWPAEQVDSVVRP